MSKADMKNLFEKILAQKCKEGIVLRFPKKYDRDYPVYSELKDLCGRCFIVMGTEQLGDPDVVENLFGMEGLDQLVSLKDYETGEAKICMVMDVHEAKIDFLKTWQYKRKKKHGT